MKKIYTILTLSLLVPVLSSAATVYDLAREFSAINNPNETWSYGSSDTLGGPLVLLPGNFTAAGNNGVPLAGWSATSGIPAIFKIVGTTTATSDGGAGQYPPGSIKAQAGDAANPGRYMISRFTVPSDGAGTYHIETAARAYLTGAASRDSDFHVLRNGVELFGISLPPNGATGYTNNLLLAASDVIDFATGPGADGSSFASGLFVTARLVTQCEQGTNVVVVTNSNPTVVTNTIFFTNVVVITNTSIATNIVVITNDCPPLAGNHFDVSADFALSANPNGEWSYGYLTALDGTFGLLQAARTFGAENGVPIGVWELNTYQLPIVAKIIGNETAISDRFTLPSGTIYFAPGLDESPENFGVIRFTVPAGGAGVYRIATAVQTLFDSTRSRDADFHVVKNGQELFSQFMEPNSGTGYTNVVQLSGGDTIDFAVGRGADGLTSDSALKISASLTKLESTLPNLANVRVGINSAGLSRQKGAPLLQDVKQATRSLQHLREKVNRRIGTENAQLAAELQEWIDQLIGPSPE